MPLFKLVESLNILKQKIIYLILKTLQSLLILKSKK